MIIKNSYTGAAHVMLTTKIVLFVSFFCSFAHAVFPNWAIEKYSTKEQFQQLIVLEKYELEIQIKETTESLYSEYNRLKESEKNQKMNQIFLLRNALVQKTGNFKEPLIDLHYLTSNVASVIVESAIGCAKRKYHTDESQVENGVLYFMIGKGKKDVNQKSTLGDLVIEGLQLRDIKVFYPRNEGIIGAIFMPISTQVPVPKGNRWIGCIFDSSKHHGNKRNDSASEDCIEARGKDLFEFPSSAHFSYPGLYYYNWQYLVTEIDHYDFNMQNFCPSDYFNQYSSFQIHKGYNNLNPAFSNCNQDENYVYDISNAQTYQNSFYYQQLVCTIPLKSNRSEFSSPYDQYVESSFQKVPKEK